MSNYEKFDEALRERKRQSYLELKTELKNIQVRLEKFLSSALESSTSRVERDFKVQSF